MVSLIQQAWNEINLITQNFDQTRKKLINWQMQVIQGLDNIRLMPDVITLAITAIDTSQYASNDLSSELASFIYGLVFMAKARYETVINRNKIHGLNLIKTTAEMFINNIGVLLSNSNQSIDNILNTLRKVFLNSEKWIKSLLEFFLSKKYKETKEDYIDFIDIILQKILRYPFLMNKSRLYSEIAYDHYDLLIERKTFLLTVKYPVEIQISHIVITGFFNLICFLATVICLFNVVRHPLRAIIFAIFTVLLFIALRFPIRSFQRKKNSRISELKEYKNRLKEIQLSGN